MRISRFQLLGRRARSKGPGPGFSLVEVLVATTILVIGMAALAGLVGQTLSGTDRALRYLSVATTLASEKLEDLELLAPFRFCRRAGGRKSDGQSTRQWDRLIITTISRFRIRRVACPKPLPAPPARTLLMPTSSTTPPVI